MKTYIVTLTGSTAVYTEIRVKAKSPKQAWAKARELALERGHLWDACNGGVLDIAYDDVIEVA